MSKEVVCENVTCNNNGNEEDFDNNIGVPPIVTGKQQV